ncbi:uracil DNA glycosylase superfamily protein [Clostridium tepidiprofundi DSM 19306]|uniref:Type-4 uracil-DNA glycosylase n=1 Tax=Clostridium tepidiprofundi DSM 19306 TaxID=1121338 RepID=A0A151B6N4_9CLOT|nr:uracil-DNA glycosylase [Clostridium tepidiprofundi]KYH35440.1 uracil DNA glycosylase superfamily protein [Clostridium tepidiprofundi DSM 19306]
MFQWKELYDECLNCSKCELCKNRNKMVFGEGNINADIMFIGEAPGGDEDRTGVPFVGKAGQLLNKALTALELTREEDYYICNICKCRPPKNRNPKEEEAYACLPYLRNQAALIKPKIIVCLGSVAMRYVISKEWRITRNRGQWIKRKGVYMMATFHPAALLRDESKKKFFWQDLKSVKARYIEIKNK